MRDFLANIITRLGVLKGVLPLSRAAAARDALAGVQLASMDIPQVLGYARIAGMPAVTGLYTVFLPLIAFAFFGASRHLVVAADSATATIFASRLSTMAPASSAEYAALAGMVLRRPMGSQSRSPRLGYSGFRLECPGWLRQIGRAHV